MAGLASAFFALIIILPCTSANAGDLFTGFQMDNEEQYFAYLGLREDLPWRPFEFETFAQLFGAGQNYEYESGNRDIDADVQSLTPSLGIGTPRLPDCSRPLWSQARHQPSRSSGRQPCRQHRPPGLDSRAS